MSIYRVVFSSFLCGNLPPPVAHLRALLQGFVSITRCAAEYNNNQLAYTYFRRNSLASPKILNCSLIKLNKLFFSKR